MGKDKKTRRLKRTKAKTERLQDILLLYNLIIFFIFIPLLYIKIWVKIVL